ncbi:hypothetical protein HMPREF1549_00604 [Actinomyces johnsonii F0510]|uniref:Uncharacterized protein n=1 Tax=Actinomyces johnsonii F0510 TaxID=1227262 RepID=U1QI07_9ACTO|nr:hypothetical protein HMPREF1549_00604 [Actinomyces johnsonii F0510]
MQLHFFFITPGQTVSTSVQSLRTSNNRENTIHNTDLCLK